MQTSCKLLPDLRNATTMPPESKPYSSRRWIVWSLRVVVLVVVCVGVGGTVQNALDQLANQQWHLRPTWLVVAGVLYAIGLVPMAWFWYRLLHSLAQPTPWPATLRAYFLGHLGKYVPGKAMAVILRVAAVRRWVPSMRVAILSTMLETLTMMAVGAFLAAAISIFLLRAKPELAGIALLAAIAVGVPTLPPIARRIARFGLTRIRRTPDDDAKRVAGAESSTPQEHGTGASLRSAPATQSSPSSMPTRATSSEEHAIDAINVRLLAEGWGAAATCWLFLGLSLWATLRAIGVDSVSPIYDLPMLVAVVAMAVVAGFVSMLPGGLGVRDLALVQLLAEHGGPADALVAAVIMRLVWLVSELAVCVILYIAARMGQKRSTAD
jgi:hypothetical protein